MRGPNTWPIGVYTKQTRTQNNKKSTYPVAFNEAQSYKAQPEYKLIKPKLNTWSSKPTWDNLDPKINSTHCLKSPPIKAQCSKYQPWGSKDNLTSLLKPLGYSPMDGKFTERDDGCTWTMAAWEWRKWVWGEHKLVMRAWFLCMRVWNGCGGNEGNEPKTAFKKSVESGMTRPSRIRLEVDRDEFDTRYLDSTWIGWTRMSRPIFRVNSVNSGKKIQ